MSPTPFWVMPRTAKAHSPAGGHSAWAVSACGCTPMRSIACTRARVNPCTCVPIGANCRRCPRYSTGSSCCNCPAGRGWRPFPPAVASAPQPQPPAWTKKIAASADSTRFSQAFKPETLIYPALAALVFEKLGTDGLFQMRYAHQLALLIALQSRREHLGVVGLRVGAEVATEQLHQPFVPQLATAGLRVATAAQALSQRDAIKAAARAQAQLGAVLIGAPHQGKRARLARQNIAHLAVE